MKEINWEELSFHIITFSGMAKSSAMNAIGFAKKGKFNKASELILEAEKNINEASHKHMDVITQEAKGRQHDFKVLFLHAEDQLLTTQTIILFAKEFIDIYKKINK